MNGGTKADYTGRQRYYEFFFDRCHCWKRRDAEEIELDALASRLRVSIGARGDSSRFTRSFFLLFSPRKKSGAGFIPVSILVRRRRINFRKERCTELQMFD